MVEAELREGVWLSLDTQSSAVLGNYTKESSTELLVMHARPQAASLVRPIKGESRLLLPATQDNRNPRVSSAAVWTQAAAALKQAERRVGPLLTRIQTSKPRVLGGFR